MHNIQAMPPRYSHPDLEGFPGLTCYSKKLKSGKTVLYWRLDGKAIGSGTPDDMKAAYLLFKSQSDNPIVERMGGNHSNLLWSDVIDLFERDYYKFQTDAADARNIWSERTALEHRRRLKVYRGKFLKRPFNSISQTEISQLVKSFVGDGQVQNRNLLIHVYRFALDLGACMDNLAENTLPPLKRKRRTVRLDKAGFDAIYAVAPNWLQNAMDISLLTLQARQEVLLMKRSDIVDGHLRVVRLKTAKYTEKAYIAIQIGPELDKIIKRCRFGERLICRNGKPIDPHWFSKVFRRCVDQTGLWKGVERPPGFHQIRSLGADLYLQAGYPKEFIQALMGHTTESMTDHYLEGHGNWQRAEAR